MTEQLISFEVAKLAKEAGFDWKITTAYVDLTPLELFTEDVTEFVYQADHNNKPHRTSAPTQSLLAKWLRDVHNIHICVAYRHDETDNKYEMNVIVPEDDVTWTIESEIYPTYEAVLEEGLKEGLRGLISRGN